MKLTILLCFLLEISLVLNALCLGFSWGEVVCADVTFRHYTRANCTSYTLLQTGKLVGAALDPSKPCKFIIHGYTQNAGKPWICKMKDTYLEKGDYNVIAVDWSRRAAQIYDESAANTIFVGQCVARFVIDLKNTLGVLFKNIHLIGHSLGAHVAGSCGKYLLANCNKTIGRITGMDPAGPFFCVVCRYPRLCPGDADFVDNIHTDGGEFGCIELCGHIDFFPNGGTPLQPGCIREVLNIDTFNPPALVCSHCRAYSYYTESINCTGFISHECDCYENFKRGSCKSNQVAVMGENVDQNLSGVFYLTTNPSPPFARYGSI